MKDRHSSPEYIKYISACLIISLSIISFILYNVIQITFTLNSQGNKHLLEAIEWQQASGGVVSLASRDANLFKDLQARHVLNQNNINTLILGSSTVMGAREGIYSEKLQVFNAAKNRNTLGEILGEAEYYLVQYPDIKYLFINYDWALGHSFSGGGAVKSFKPAFLLPELSFGDKIKDAASFQRLKIIIHKLYTNLFTEGKKIYDCPQEENIGIDLDNSESSGLCDGFRPDGSATFSRFDRMNEGSWNWYLSENGYKRYSKNISKYKGVTGDVLLQSIRDIDSKLKERSGELVIFLPPLLPRMVEAIEGSDAREFLMASRSTLLKLSIEDHISVFDASKSEQFGCLYHEFLDGHHALPECYSKIINSFNKRFFN